ncbi:hypothetical protein ACFX12_005744 [Malus domestica]
MERESKPNPEILQPISSLSLRDRERKLERERKPKKPPNPLDQAKNGAAEVHRSTKETVYGKDGRIPALTRLVWY